MGDYIKFMQSEIEKLASRLKWFITEYSFLFVRIANLILVIIVFELLFKINNMDMKIVRTILYSALYVYCMYTIIMSIVQSIRNKLDEQDNIKSNRKYICKEDVELVAYHEAGHAIIARITCKNHRIENISIIPKEESSGRVEITSKTDFYKKSDILAEIQFHLGGLVAESIIYGEHSTGCCNDIKKAKDCAYYMLGDVAMGKHMVYNTADYKDVDAEVDGILKAERKKAEYVLKRYETVLENLKQELMIREDMREEEIDIFFLIHGI